MNVTLREKPIKDNLLSLYLDFYPPIPSSLTGKPTRREFLSLYAHSEFEYELQQYTDPKGLLKERIVPVLDRKGEHRRRRLTEIEREHNQKTRSLATAVAAQRQLEIQAGRFGFLDKSKPAEVDFLEFFRKKAAAYQLTNQSQGNKNNMNSAYRHFTIFIASASAKKRPSNEELDKQYLAGKDLTKQVCEDFKEYIIAALSLKRPHKPLAPNSAVGYFVLFKRVVTEAFDKGLLDYNPADKIVVPKLTDIEREFLTEEELQALAKAECEWPMLKQASLFSAFTGLRYSDVEKLTWGEVFHSQKLGYYLRFTIKKGGRPETLYISDQAYSLMGERRADSERVFEGLAYSDWQNSKIRDWVLRAGIKKHITFHCFRHTNATLLLTLGEDIYTVKEMLGHRSLTSTQVYARVIDKRKKEAANRINLDI
jgi:integrase